jgi:hypothetical protein
MHVFLDNRPLHPQPTIAAALRSGVEEAGRTGRVVVEALLDGAAVAEDILENPPNEAIGEELRLTSVDPSSLVRVTLLDAADALESAREEQRRSAELIQSGKVEEAMDPLSSALQTWQAVREAVEKSAALVRIPLDSVEFEGAAGSDRLLDLLAGLTSRLEEVKRSLSTQDWSALADVLAYDLTEQSDRWRTMLRSLAESLKK